MNGQRLEGAAPHAQALMNHMHHYQNYNPTMSMNGMRLEDISATSLVNFPLFVLLMM